MLEAAARTHNRSDGGSCAESLQTPVLLWKPETSSVAWRSNWQERLGWQAQSDGERPDDSHQHVR